MHYRLFDEPKTSHADVNIFGLQTVYIVVFFVSSALSLYLSGYLYCLCMFYICVNNDTLQRALRSITKNGISLTIFEIVVTPPIARMVLKNDSPITSPFSFNSYTRFMILYVFYQKRCCCCQMMDCIFLAVSALLWVAAFILVVLFIYSVLAFGFLHQSFFLAASQDEPLFCETLAQCFGTVVRFQLLDELGAVSGLYKRSRNNMCTATTLHTFMWQLIDEQVKLMSLSLIIRH